MFFLYLLGFSYQQWQAGWLPPDTSPCVRRPSEGAQWPALPHPYPPKRQGAGGSVPQASTLPGKPKARTETVGPPRGVGGRTRPRSDEGGPGPGRGAAADRLTSQAGRQAGRRGGRHAAVLGKAPPGSGGAAISRRGGARRRPGRRAAPQGGRGRRGGRAWEARRSWRWRRCGLCSQRLWPSSLSAVNTGRPSCPKLRARCPSVGGFLQFLFSRSLRAILAVPVAPLFVRELHGCSASPSCGAGCGSAPCRVAFQFL